MASRGLLSLSTRLLVIAGVLVGMTLIDMRRPSLPDPFMHVISYAAITALVLHATRRRWPRAEPWELTLFSAFVVTGFACFDEGLQSWFPQREASLKDVAYDLLGGVAILVSYLAFVSRRRQPVTHLSQDNP